MTAYYILTNSPSLDVNPKTCKNRASYVRRSYSAWVSPLHITVPKTFGDWQPRRDYRRRNDIAVADRHPIPHIQDFASQLEGSSIFSTTIDIIKGYHQTPVAAEDVHTTAVITPSGVLVFVRMPFGLRNSDQSSQRLMGNVLQGIDFIFLVHLSRNTIITFASCLRD